MSESDTQMIGSVRVDRAIIGVGETRRCPLSVAPRGRPARGACVYPQRVVGVTDGRWSPVAAPFNVRSGTALPLAGA